MRWIIFKRSLFNFIMLACLMNLVSCKKDEQVVPSCNVNEVMERAEREFCEVHQVHHLELSESEISVLDTLETKTFQIMVWNVVDTLDPIYQSLDNVNKMIDHVNEVYDTINFKFELFALDTITNYYTYEDLVKDNFKAYYYGLIKNNVENIIDVYLVDHEKDLCYNDGRTAGCQKGHGFTGVGSAISSIVIGKDDLLDAKVVVHELGHFFNLQHTHRGMGLDEAKEEDCNQSGDFICDTPVDPGATVYSAMVNYTLCEMFGAYDKDGIPYKPMINNFMSYYSPCYMRKYAFSDSQLDMMKAFAMSPQRRYFICLE